MKVLINTPALDLPGGVSKYCSVIRSHFKEDVRYFTVGKQTVNEGALKKTLSAIGCYFRFLTALRSRDLVHINPSLGPSAVIRDGVFLLIAKLCGKKVVVFFHGWDEGCERQIRRFFLLPFRFVFFRADAIVLLATVFGQRLVDMGYRKKIYLQTTTVDDAMFSHAASLTTRGSQTASQAFNILYLSRIEKAKGIYEAIDAYALVKKGRPQVSLTVVGDGDELSRVRDYVADQGIPGVDFRGHLSGQAIRDAFAEADAYLFPTWYGEGLPISILEAMVYGLPVLTRPVGGIPDFFQDGKMGFLRETRDPGVFAELLEELIAAPELRRSMRDYNQRYAQQHFRPSIIAGRLEEIYLKTLALPSERIC
jgi:glycosyltransferase involved in cell wall biosynthesis